MWAIAWRVPNDPSGQPVPLTIEFVMETQIDVECKLWDAETDLNGIALRPGPVNTEHTDVDTTTMTVNDYSIYLRERGHHTSFENTGKRNGMMVQRQESDMPRSFMMPQSSFAQHIALDSDNFLTRLDGAVLPGGQTNLANGYEAQNAINRGSFSNAQLIDMSNNTNNIATLMTTYQGNPSTYIAP